MGETGRRGEMAPARDVGHSHGCPRVSQARRQVTFARHQHCLHNTLVRLHMVELHSTADVKLKAPDSHPPESIFPARALRFFMRRYLHHAASTCFPHAFPAVFPSTSPSTSRALSRYRYCCVATLKVFHLWLNPNSGASLARTQRRQTGVQSP